NQLLFAFEILTFLDEYKVSRVVGVVDDDDDDGGRAFDMLFNVIIDILCSVFNSLKDMPSLPTLIISISSSMVFVVFSLLVLLIVKFFCERSNCERRFFFVEKWFFFAKDVFLWKNGFFLRKTF